MKIIRKKLDLNQKGMAGPLNNFVTSLGDIKTGESRPDFDILFNSSVVNFIRWVYLLHGLGGIYLKTQASTHEEKLWRENTSKAEELFGMTKIFRLAMGIGAIIALSQDSIYKIEKGTILFMTRRRSKMCNFHHIPIAEVNRVVMMRRNLTLGNIVKKSNCFLRLS